METLTEKELEYIFSNKKPKKSSRTRRTVVVILLFIFATVTVYVLLNFQSVRSILTFWYESEFSPQQQTNVLTLNQSNSSQSVKSLNFEDIPDNSINIPAIKVKAPISWDIPNVPDKVATGLSKGIIQIQGTAHPGEVGNVFITGHSSNYPWAKGNYNSIFALLNKLAIGDTVQLKYKNQNYLYRISSAKVVEPTDISVMKSSNDSVLTLMTCTPVGTTLRRLIVTAKQIHPEAKANKPLGTNQIDQQNLPPSH